MGISGGGVRMPGADGSPEEVRRVTPKDHWLSRAWWAGIIGIGTLVIAGLTAWLVFSPPGGDSVPTHDGPPQSASSSGPVDAPAVTPPAPASKAAKIIQVAVASAGDYRRIGTGVYELKEAPSLDVKYNWYTVTNYGKIDSGVKTCDVAITVTNIDTGKVVDGAHSAECSLDDGYYESSLSEGRYRVAVVVLLSSRSRGSGTYSFRIVP